MVTHGRYHQVALHLPKLPPEVVHEIIGDLSIINLLQIVCSYDLPYVDECICSHMDYRKIFSSAQSLTEVKKYFSLFQRLCSLKYRKPTPRAWVKLDYDAVSFLQFKKDDEGKDLAGVIIELVKAAILTIMGDYERYLPLLKAYAPRDIPEPQFWSTDTIEDLTTLFEDIDAAEMTINTLKVKQLNKLIELMRRYPGWLRLRDRWSQEANRNEAHIIEAFERVARDVGRRRMLSGCLKGQSVFAPEHAFLIPYDRFLRAFIKVIDKYPPTIYEKAVDKNATRHEYPAAMQTALDGMEFVYRRQVAFEEFVQSHRTRNTRWAEAKKRSVGPSNPPTFDTAWQRGTEHMHALQGQCPIADGELEWLEAFLAVCEYMSRMTEPWKKGQTVGQWFGLHCH